MTITHAETIDRTERGPIDPVEQLQQSEAAASEAAAREAAAREAFFDALASANCALRGGGAFIERYRAVHFVPATAVQGLIDNNGVEDMDACAGTFCVCGKAWGAVLDGEPPDHVLACMEDADLPSLLEAWTRAEDALEAAEGRVVAMTPPSERPNTPASQQAARVVSIRDEQPIFEGLVAIASKAAVASACVATFEDAGPSPLLYRGVIEIVNEVGDTARRIGRQYFAGHWDDNTFGLSARDPDAGE